MIGFKLEKPIYIEELSGVWDKIPIKFLGILNIYLKGTDVRIPAEKQFSIFYRGRPLIYSTKEEAEDAFLMIFFGNKAQFLLRQIQQTELSLLDKLNDLNIWADVTKSNAENTGNRTSSTTTEGKSNNRTGNSDANSLMQKDLVIEHFNLEKDSPIPPNLLSQGLNQDESKIESTDNNTGNINSSTSFSNESNDIIKYINLDLPDLRQKFWSLFHCLFSY